ncbi:MAG: Fic family protein [Nitrospinota bacterium]
MDNNIVKKILTFKSGQFVFSRKFSAERLSNSLIEAKVLYNTVVDLPVLPELAAKIEEEVIIKSIFGTAAIEGNPLTEERVAEILSQPEGTEKLKRAEKEIRNLKYAYDFIDSLQPSESPFKLTEGIVKNVHSIITNDIEHKYNTPGQYRNHSVKVGNEEHGGIYTPPKILKDIKTLMREFMRWINTKELLELDPAIRSALVHYHLGLIHPFGDGNGRTARIVEALLLRLAGIKYIPVMLSNFYYRNIDDYFWAFSKSIDSKENDITDFLDFVFKGLIDSLKEIKAKITFYIRKFTLRDYYSHLRTVKDITQRQHDFLIILLDYLKPFTLKDLFNISPFNILYREVSERTARRDLKKMCDKNLLLIKNGKYELHFRVLG